MRSSLLSLLAASAAAAATTANTTANTTGRHGSDGLFEFTPNLIPKLENAGTDKLFPMKRCGGLKLEEATIDDMRKAMENGSLTSVQLVTCYMTRTFQTQQYIK